MFKASAIVILLIGVCHAHSGRIVGGKDTDISEIPWQVSLQHSSKNLHFCGGAIIGARWILTAAHCMETASNITNKHVVVGMTMQSEGGVKHTIKRSLRTPKYGSMGTYSYDIALLELNEPIQFNERAQPIRLPKDDEILPIGKEMLIQGWGHLSQDEPASNHLQSIRLPLWEPKDCAKAYNYAEKLFVGPLAPMICVGWPGSYPDTCNGDSGGPLSYNGIQYGIVSYGMGCANPNYPKIFTHVYNMRDFIYANTDL